MGFAVASNARFPVKRLLGDPDYVGSDVAVEHERRLAPLREVLPARGTVGYLTDLPPGRVVRSSFLGGNKVPTPPGERRAWRELFLTQYALVPVIVDPVSVSAPAAHELVVVNVHEGEDLAEPDTRGLVLVRDFGGGIRLYRAAAPSGPLFFVGNEVPPPRGEK